LKTACKETAGPALFSLFEAKLTLTKLEILSVTSLDYGLQCSVLSKVPAFIAVVCIPGEVHRLSAGRATLCFVRSLLRMIIDHLGWM
jgi:hypothetical protein